MKYLTLALLLAYACGCADTKQAVQQVVNDTVLSFSCSNNDAIDHEVMEAVIARVPDHNWADGDYTSKEELDREADIIAKLRVWVKTQPDPCIRAAYTNWLDYYQHDLQEAYGQRSRQDGLINYRETNSIPVPPEVNP